MVATLLGPAPGRTSGPAHQPLRRATAPRRAAWRSAPRPDRAHLRRRAGAGAEQVQLNKPLPVAADLLFDVRTGRVLWSANPGLALPIASLTKMMTALRRGHAQPGRATGADHPRRRSTSPAPALVCCRWASGCGWWPCSTGCCCPPATTRRSRWPSTWPARRPVHRDDERAGPGRWACAAPTSPPSPESSIRATTRARATSPCWPTRCSQQPLLARIVAARSAILPFPIKGGKLYLYNNNPLLLLGYPGDRRRQDRLHRRGRAVSGRHRPPRGAGWAWCCSTRPTRRPGGEAAQRRLRQAAGLS